jgi:hypothetical protein
MKLCNYNWNLIILGMLLKTAVHTTDIGITVDKKSVRFIIKNDGCEAWLDKYFGTNAYKLEFGFFVSPGDFVINYTIYDIRKIEIELHSGVW